MMRLIVPLGIVLLTVAATVAPVRETPHVNCQRPLGSTLFVSDLMGHLVTVPAAFACQSVAIMACEDKEHQGATAVGAAGERGSFQVHPVHRGAMARLDLGFDSEADRVRWSVILWERAGRTWRDWSCSR